MKKIYSLLTALLCLTMTVQAAVISDLTKLDNERFYTLRTERGFLFYNSTRETLCASTGRAGKGVEFNPEDPNQQFKIIKNGDNYGLYSVGAEKYVILDGQGGAKFYNEPVNPFTMTKSNNIFYLWKLQIGDFYINMEEKDVSAFGFKIDNSEVNAGSYFRIDEAYDYTDTTTDVIYDFAGFDVKAMLDLFYIVHQDGRKYPTLDEFEAVGIQASDIEFVRSHVRRAEIMSRADRLVTSTYEKRNLWTNFPMDVGSGGAAGYPSDKFTADVFSMWQYVNLFGSWNHGFFQAPGAWVDAAHRNGSDIFSGIAFFESWTGDGDATYSALITQKNENGKFKYVEPLIHCLMYFGADGINYNWEDNSYTEKDIVNFHKELYKYAAECGYDNYHSGIYTSQSSFTESTADALFGTTANGKTHDTMLNYANGDFSFYIGETVTAAESAMGTAEGLYTGVWIVGMDRRWTALDENAQAHKCGVCLWGEHGQNRFYSYNTGNGPHETQGNYQRLLERGFSGGYRNPANRPAVSNSGNNWEKDGNKLPLSTFAGMATWIPERSAIQGDMHFRTHFTLGNGDRYYYKGKKAYNSSWYNMSAQDIVPTYRWLCYKSNTTEVSNAVEVNYTHLDAYTGGSCIELTGASTADGTDIILYKTALTVGNGAYAKLAVKTLNEAKATDLYLILKKSGSNEWLEFAYGDVAGNTWEEKQIELTGLAATDVIERIGLRVKGSNSNYQLYVGKLELNNDAVIEPAKIKELVAEVKKETKEGMTAKLHWYVDAEAQTRAAWDLVYNDEANIDHFEILYKIGEEGHISLVGTTSQWAALVPNMRFESVNDVPYVGVRAVSKDLKTYSPVKWVKITRSAQNDLPEAKEEDTYGVSAMDPQCEGANIARAERYVEVVKTTGAKQDLNYTAKSPVADGSQYADARDQILVVEQGQTITMTIKCADFGDGLKWCFAGGWLDLDASGDFNHPAAPEEDPLSERIFFAGTLREATPEFQNPGLTFSFNIPNDATPGKSRLRIVFSDAWFAGMFLPTGLHAKGFTIDFSVEIEGNNPGRAAVDTRDEGAAEEPTDIVNDTTAVENVENEVSIAIGTEGAILFNNVEKAWIYTVDGKFVNFANNNPAQVAAEAGIYIVKMQNNNVIRSEKVVVK